jgi:hypothetical protein
MSEINLIITRQEDLKSLLLQCMEEHSKQKQVMETTLHEKPMSRAETTEIPAFLHFISTREMSTRSQSRMWFSASQISTKALQKVIRSSRKWLQMAKNS